MSPDCAIHQKPRLNLVGGATDSIFPEVEALLLDSSDHQYALEFISTGKIALKRYRSVIDFLFCELHFGWRPACLRFYQDKGPALREMIPPEKWAQCNKRMLKALEVAYKLFHEKRQLLWSDYCKCIEEELAAAA